MRALSKIFQIIFFQLIVLYAGIAEASIEEISTDSLLKKLSTIESDDKQELALLNEIIIAYWKVAPDSSIKYGKIALETANRIGIDSATAEVYHNLGIAYFYANSFNNSLDWLYKSLKIREKSNDNYKIGTTLNSIGNVFYALGNNAKALVFYNQSLELIRKTGNKKMEASILTNLGSLLASMGKDSKAFETLNQSIQLLEQIRDSAGISSALNNLSLVYRSKGQYEKALETDSKALEIATKLSHSWEVAYISNSIGETYLMMKNYPMAGRYFKQALEISERLGLQDVLLFSYRSLTRYYSATSNNDSFNVYFNKYDVLKDSIFTTKNAQSIAEMQVKYQTEHQAKENAMQKLQIAKERDIRNSFIFISILILVAIIILFIRYRNKKRLNIELENIVMLRTRDLSEREERYRKLISATPDAVLEADSRGYITFASSQSKPLFRIDDEKEIVGSKLEKFIADSDVARFRDNLASFYLGKYGKESQYVMLRKDGSTFSGEIKMAMIYDSSGASSGIIAVVRNITERKLIEQRILRNTIETEERERARFSEDLHDGLGPLLSTVKIYLELIAARQGNSQEQAKFIKMTDELLQESIRSTREIANNLTPNLLNDFGLIEALSVYIDKINLTNTIQINLTTDDRINRLPSQTEVALYRVLCELINNTIKHAFSTLISIVISYEEQHLKIKYTDNGIGFDVEKMLSSRTKGLGLSNIMSRVNSVNGTCVFTSEPGKCFICQIIVKV